MKKFLALAAFMFAAFLASSVQAATISGLEGNQLGTTLAAGDIVTDVTVGASGLAHETEYRLLTRLANATQVVFTYAFTNTSSVTTIPLFAPGAIAISGESNLSKAWDDLVHNTLPVVGTTLTTSFSDGYAHNADNSIKLYATWDAANLLGTFTFVNNSGAAVTLAMLIDALVSGKNGLLTVSANVAATPIPAALGLFGAGLLGLAGYRRRKSA